MITHPELSVLIITDADGSTDIPWSGFGHGMDHVRISYAEGLPADLGDINAIITSGNSIGSIDSDRILRFVKTGGAWFGLVGLTDVQFPQQFGVQPGPAGPRAELRVLFTDSTTPIAARLPDAVYVNGLYRPLNVTDARVETVLYADWHYSHSSVLTFRSYGEGHLCCTTLQDFSSQLVRQTIYRLLRTFQNEAPASNASLGVGILGYAPSVGKLHGLAVENSPGLHLVAACDLNPQQLDQATRDFPFIVTYEDAAAMALNPRIDLVIVVTAPNSHAMLSMQMMAAGKHVLCEKPLALSKKETREMQEMAVRYSRHLSCHQNRRFDPDFLAIKLILDKGGIGDPFYVETFVGGFHHPCGYWHSHTPVSGGTSFDWGAHYIDWLVGLLPYPVEAVIGTRHKRVWHDVTNGDQERIQIRFADGREAEFIHSDIAAVRKPKWYLLGTAGAIHSDWRDITAFDVDPVHYFSKTVIPATEMMPDITQHRRLETGDIELVTPALPERDPLAFHYNLADHLLWGEALAAPLADSVTVVSILEAAARSMAHGGSVERLNEL